MDLTYSRFRRESTTKLMTKYITTWRRNWGWQPRGFLHNQAKKRSMSGQPLRPLVIIQLVLIKSVSSILYLSILLHVYKGLLDIAVGSFEDSGHVNTKLLWIEGSWWSSWQRSEKRREENVSGSKYYRKVNTICTLSSTRSVSLSHLQLSLRYGDWKLEKCKLEKYVSLL
jgi:hypothetical protein